MTTTPYGLLALERDVSRYVDLEAKIRELQGEVDDIKARMREALPVGKHETSLGLTVSVTPNRRFNEAQATEVLTMLCPPETLKACQVTKIDSAAAKAVLGGAMYELCKANVGAPVVRIG